MKTKTKKIIFKESNAFLMNVSGIIALLLLICTVVYYMLKHQISIELLLLTILFLLLTAFTTCGKNHARRITEIEDFDLDRVFILFKHFAIFFILQFLIAFYLGSFYSLSVPSFFVAAALYSSLFFVGISLLSLLDDGSERF